MQARFALNLGSDIAVTIHAQHCLILLQRLVTKAAIVLKVSMRFVILQDNSGQAFSADGTRRKSEAARQQSKHTKSDDKDNGNCNADWRKERR